MIHPNGRFRKTREDGQVSANLSVWAALVGDVLAQDRQVVAVERAPSAVIPELLRDDVGLGVMAFSRARSGPRWIG